MPESTDRRVRRTRKLLQDGLLALMRRKPLEDITVKELAETADVARATVYVHFKDPADVLAQLEQSIYADVDAILARHAPAELAQSPAALLGELFAYVRENRPSFEVLLGDHGDRAFAADLRALCAERASAALRLKIPGADDAAIAYRAVFLVGGYETLLQRWMLGGCQEPPEELARLAGQIA